MSDKHVVHANSGGDYPIKLPDCPLCGSKLTVHHIGNNHTKNQKLKVKCSNNRCRIERTDAAIGYGIEFLIKCQENAWQAAQAQAGDGKDQENAHSCGAADAWLFREHGRTICAV